MPRVTVPRPRAVQLLPEEIELLMKIDFGLPSNDYRENQAILAAAAALTKRLIRRRAVPDIRARYLTDPELNVGCRMGSRIEVFERNGTKGDDIFKHPHFLRYLSYILYGPELPTETIDGFRKVVEEDFGTSGMVMDQLKKFTRAEVRRLGMERYRAKEEFYKLALECELHSHLTLVIRDAAASAR